MRTIAPDYVPPENEFATVEDGKYKVRGFEWITKDESDNPILVAQKGGRMVARLRFTLLDDLEGPPYSLSLSDMPLLVKVLGGDITKLLPIPELEYPAKVAKYMTQVKDLTQEGEEVEVEVKKGWVTTIPGMEVPAGLFYLRLTDLSPVDEDGDPYPLDGQYGKFFFISFEVVSGEGGAKTPYEGVQTRELMNYSIDVDDDDEPDFTRTPTGAYTKSATFLAHTMEYTAPTMFEDGWIPTDPANLLPDWLREAKLAKKVVKAYRSREPKGKFITTKWETLEPVTSKVRDYDQSIGEVEQKSGSIHEVDVDFVARQLLVDLLTLLAGGPACQSGSFQLTDIGKTVAREYLSPLRKEGVLKTGSIVELDFDQIKAAFARILVNVPIDKLSASNAIDDKLIAVGVRIVDEDSENEF